MRNRGITDLILALDNAGDILEDIQPTIRDASPQLCRAIREHIAAALDRTHLLQGIHDRKMKV
jgi:hypothetical protein